WAELEALSDVGLLVAVGPSIRFLPAAWLRRIPFVLVHTGPHGVCPVAVGWRNGQSCSIGFPRCLNCTVVGQKNGWENVRQLSRFLVLNSAVSAAAANVFVSGYLKQRAGSRNGTVIWNCFDSRVYCPANSNGHQGKKVFT